MPKPKPPAPGASAQPAAVVGDNRGPLDVEHREIDPKLLKPQAINARFMTALQMEQLTANLRQDGKLTSAVLAYQPPGQAELETLSGHHRAEASVRAGLSTIPVIVITSPLTEARKRAIQLSHNAIVGQDDPTTLASMYADLDLSSKAYSGLDDSVLAALKDVTLGGLNVGLDYQEMTFLFLPEDREMVTQAIKTLDRAARKNQAFVARHADFDAFFEAVVKVKTQFAAFNTGIAMRLLIDLAMERLAQIEAAEPAAAAEAA